MDAPRFRNILVSLMNIDLHELVEAGVIAEGNLDNGGSSWSRFNDQPLVFVAKLGDQQLEALWCLVEARQKPSSSEADAEDRGYQRGLTAGVSMGIARARMAVDRLRVPDIVEDARKPAEPFAALTAASHALRSYQYGNASPELAESVADSCDEALAALGSGTFVICGVDLAQPGSDVTAYFPDPEA